MSRDRYKYITQADFNKKLFLNTQKRKTKLMPQLLHGVDIEYWMNKKTSRHVPTFSGRSTNNARFAFLERLEKQGEKCKDFEEEEDNPFAMPSRPKPPEKQQLPEFYRIRLKEQEEAEIVKATFPTQPVIRPVTQKSVAFCPADKKEVKFPDVAQSAKGSSMTRQQSLPPSTPDRKAHQARRAQSSGAVSARSIHDPRYMTLENSLSGENNKSEQLDPERVQSIINAQDSLHIPSRHSVNARPKLQKTILEYLRARGFMV